MSKVLSHKEGKEKKVHEMLYGTSHIPTLIGYYIDSEDHSSISIRQGKISTEVFLSSEKNSNVRIAKLEKRIAELEKSFHLFRDPPGYPINYKYGIRKAYNKIKLYLQSPFGEKYFHIIFEKNEYISSEKDAWKIIYIINNEKIFEDTLQEFNFSINKNFIESLFQKSDQYFYIDKFSHKISTNRILSTAYYEEISLYQLLKYLNINEIESLIEKGSIIYAS